MKVIWLHERRGINPRRIMKLFTGSIRQRKKKKRGKLEIDTKSQVGPSSARVCFFVQQQQQQQK